MTKLYSLLAFFLITIGWSQSNNLQKFPVFPSCSEVTSDQEESCFYNTLQDFYFNNFKIEKELVDNNYKGVVNLLFEVDSIGKFRVLYVNSMYKSLSNEATRVLEMLPQIKPSTYNGKATYAKYSYKINIPLTNSQFSKIENADKSDAQKIKEQRDVVLNELDSLARYQYKDAVLTSKLNIPFSHSYYAQFDAQINHVGSNNHTASKPLTYSEVGKYYDFIGEKSKLLKNKSTWLGKKLFNENFFEYQGDNYWITVNPLLDVRLGKSSPSDIKYTYNNTRGINLQAGLGSQLVFTTTIYESQGRFADYYNSYAETLRPSGGNPASIPGIGIAKEFKEDAYDFPLAEANITYTPSNFFNMQLGYGRNFIGDGYRSLLASDGASPYPFVKLNTTFWKVKYTNTFTWLKDVREVETVDRTYATKFMAHHYLSWNITNRLNLGFFESVIWGNDNDRGFDMNFVNPIIFYRAVEFSSSSRSGNAVLGLTGKYKINNQINLYGQFILDEFSLGEIKKRDNSWSNKYGYQIGAKYYNALNIPNLLLQIEYNHIRPYVYSHSNPLTNYGHNNMSLGHQWGGNARELIGIARYHKDRFFADGKLTYGVRGFDFDTAENNFNYGGNIYRDYDDNRPNDYGVKIGQGNKTTIMMADLQAGYLLNPNSNLKLFANYIYRSFDPTFDTAKIFKQNTSWFMVGIRADLFNWYFDY